MGDQRSFEYSRANANPNTIPPALDNTFTPVSSGPFGNLYTTPIAPDSGIPLLTKNIADVLTIGTGPVANNNSLTYATVEEDPTTAAPVEGRLGTTMASDGSNPQIFGIATVAMVAGYDRINDVFKSIGLVEDGDALDSTNRKLQVAACGFGFNGTAFDRLKTGSAANAAANSSAGVLLVTPTGEWAVNHTPAAATQATITKAAGGAGVRHVCKSITATFIGLAAAAEATVLVNLRDGATGAGTILWSTRLLVTGTTGSETGVTISNLNIVGSDNTDMTLEFAAAGAANTFESVAMTGYDAQ